MSESEQQKADMLWGGDKRDLQEQLDERYGVEGIWIQGDYYHEEEDEYLYDVLTYFDGDEEHLITDSVPLFGHAESGAAGVYVITLPDEETVREVVRGAKGGQR